MRKTISLYIASSISLLVAEKHKGNASPMWQAGTHEVCRESQPEPRPGQACLSRPSELLGWVCSKPICMRGRGASWEGAHLGCKKEPVQTADLVTGL